MDCTRLDLGTLVFVLLLAGCSESSTTFGPASTSQGDSGAPTDADPSTDSDADTDTDADTDVDSDTDADTDSSENSDAGSDTDDIDAGSQSVACIHECVPSSFCTGKHIVHTDRFCKDANDVCCEPTQDDEICSDPFRCIPDSKCPAADTRTDEGKCLKNSNVCCNAKRCQQVGGECVLGISDLLALCTPPRRATTRFSCPGLEATCCL